MAHITFNIQEKEEVMKKSLVVTLLVVVMGLGLSGALKAEDGVTDTEIVIGSHMDISGPGGAWGTLVRNGLEMKAKEINEAGGIYGRKIRLVIEDSQYDPKKAIMVTNKMINRDKVFAFICNLGSACGLATRPIIERKKIPQMFPLSASTKLYEPFNRYTFGGATPAYDEGRAIVKYFVEHKKYNRIGIFCQDDEMGATLIRAVKDQLATYNLKPLAIETYKRGAMDFSSQIAKLKKADVQLVALGTVLRETVGAWKEAKKIGWEVDMCGLKQTMTAYVPLLCQKAGVSPEGLYATSVSPFIHKDSPRPKAREWWKKYMEVYGKPPDQPSIYGPTVLHYFEIAAKRAGRDLTREKFVDALETFRDVQDPIFGTIPFSYTKTNHQGMTAVILQQYRNGLYRPVVDKILDYRK